MDDDARASGARMLRNATNSTLTAASETPSLIVFAMAVAIPISILVCVFVCVFCQDKRRGNDTI